MKSILLFLLLICTSVYGQKPIKLPRIECDTCNFCAPKGWEINEKTPDVIRGNGRWPGPCNHCNIIGVDGDSADGNMAMFICGYTSSGESWKTTLKGLKVGKKYVVSLKWQQIAHQGVDRITYAGGGLYMSVGDQEKRYFSDESFNDEWHQVDFVFTATAKTETLIIACYVPEVQGCEGMFGCAIVVDNSKFCLQCLEAGGLE